MTQLILYHYQNLSTYFIVVRAIFWGKFGFVHLISTLFYYLLLLLTIHVFFASYVEIFLLLYLRYAIYAF